MTPTFYVAAASSEHERVREVVVRLASAGLEPFYDWSQIGPASAFSGRDRDYAPAARLAAARAALQACRECSVLVLLLPVPPAASVGAWVELGAAIEARRLRERPAIVVAGGDSGRTIFTELADAVCETDAEAVSAALGLAATFARPQ